MSPKKVKALPETQKQKYSKKIRDLSALPRSLVAEYPGFVLWTKMKSTSEGIKAVKLLQSYLGIKTSGSYDALTAERVAEYQATHNDLSGNPLEVDGKVGPMTWGSIFDEPEKPQTDLKPTESLDIITKTLQIAKSQIGITERPPGSNRGPEVETYLKTSGVGPGNPWCMAFVYWCYVTAAKELGVPVPIVKTALVADLYNWGRKNKKLKTKPRVGDMFMVRGGPNGHCHVGFVSGIVNSGYIKTIEGNTNSGGSREGICVMSRERKIGNLDFTGV